jgi:hypothetical protein
MVSVVDPALTDWPAERPTDTTVPLIGAVSWAASRFCWASMREALAESMDAWSLASCSALFDAVDVPLGLALALLDGLLSAVPAAKLFVLDGLLAVDELAVVPELFVVAGADPPVDDGLLPLLVVGAVEPPEGCDPPVPPPPPPFGSLPELAEDDVEPNNWARAVSAWATAFWSVWTCFWATNAWANAAAQAGDPVAFEGLDGVDDGVVDGVLAVVADVEQAVSA